MGSFKKGLFVSIILTFSLFGSSILCAGVIDLSEDAPAILKTINFLLNFLSENIKSQSLAVITWLITLSVILQGIARLLAELLGLFANKTKTDLDNKAMLFFSNTAKYIGRFIAWFGVGSLPKSLR